MPTSDLERAEICTTIVRGVQACERKSDLVARFPSHALRPLHPGVGRAQRVGVNKEMSAGMPGRR